MKARFWVLAALIVALGGAAVYFAVLEAEHQLAKRRWRGLIRQISTEGSALQPARRACWYCFRPPE
jgi:hypothetical protein